MIYHQYGLGKLEIVEIHLPCFECLNNPLKVTATKNRILGKKGHPIT